MDNGNIMLKKNEHCLDVQVVTTGLLSFNNAFEC
jgi:hypothetical protein